MPNEFLQSPKLAVPAYFGPWQREDWAALRTDRPSIVVINPDNGPGRRRPGYRPLVRDLQKRGVEVFGYITTGWLQRPWSDWAQDVARYAIDYGVDGVLFDEVEVDSANLSALRKLDAIGRSAVARVAFNPGRAIPDRWRQQFPKALWITFEGTARQYLDRVPDEVSRPADWHLVHSVPKSLQVRVAAKVASAEVGYAYLTADRMPNPWDVYDTQWHAERRRRSSAGQLGSTQSRIPERTSGFASETVIPTP